MESPKPKYTAAEDIGPSGPIGPGHLEVPPGNGVTVDLSDPWHWPALPQLPELPTIDLNTSPPPPRMPLHVVCASRDGSAGGASEFYSVSCSCGWEGRQLADSPDHEDATIDLLAQEWRAHVRLSERVYRRSKKFILQVVNS